jgi:hypothetical protein
VFEDLDADWRSAYDVPRKPIESTILLAVNASLQSARLRTSKLDVQPPLPGGGGNRFAGGSFAR